VFAQPTTLAAAEKAIVAEIRRPPAGRDPIAVNDGLTVRGRLAFRYTFGEAGAYNEQWWISGRSGTFRIDIWAPVASQSDVGALGDRVVRTFEVL
jgi:hypothetical protein